jgi:hypothetical protein
MDHFEENKIILWKYHPKYRFCPHNNRTCSVLFPQMRRNIVVIELEEMETYEWNTTHSSHEIPNDFNKKREQNARYI